MPGFWTSRAAPSERAGPMTCCVTGNPNMKPRLGPKCADGQGLGRTGDEP
jgi:hypothetical protein